MVTEINVQDLDSHNHVPLVAPTWESICRSMGEPISTLSPAVHEAYAQAVDQFNYFEDLRVEALTPVESLDLAA